ncbi:MAG: GvpL/GvpF family gas vesicle protein, partial [Actinomycetes bacterium]
VYGIVHADRPVDGMTGLDATPLRLVQHGGLAAVVNDIQVERPPGRKADLMAYRRVLDDLAAVGPVIPVQFGSVMLDDDSVALEVLDGREDWLFEMLVALRGRSQFHLQASYHEDVALKEIVDANPLVARLRERTRALPEDASYADRVQLGELVAHAMEEKRTLDIQALLEVVSPHVDDLRVTPRADAEGLATIALLVDDAHTAELEDELESLAEDVHERIRLGLVGPMAPYDFVDGA